MRAGSAISGTASGKMKVNTKRSVPLKIVTGQRAGQRALSSRAG